MAKYEKGNGRFVNPYNFISVTKDIDRQYGVESQKSELHSGYLNCTLEVITPLSIPDTAARTFVEIKKNKWHYSYPFMTIGGKPFIPASSIRGALRNIYETVTDSCMGTLRPNTTISTRVGFDNKWTVYPGILFRNMDNSEWELYEAQRYGIVIDSKNYKRTDRVGGNRIQSKFSIGYDEKGKYIVTDAGEKIRYGDHVSFSSDSPRGFTKGKYKVWEGTVERISAKSGLSQEGYAYIGETFAPRKHAESIFVKKGKVCEKAFTKDELKKCLEDSVAEYQDSAVNRNLGDSHTGYKGYERAKDNGVLPIWYRKDGSGNIYLSMAAIGRIQYKKSVNDLAGEVCRDRSKLCKACALFGMAGSKDNKSMGSHIRVTDAECIEDTRTEECVTLKELGKPRTSYLPFYAKDGNSYDDPGAEIRGRKFYWHNPKAAGEQSVYTTDEKTDRNASHQLMMPGGKFKFRVYYDRIDESQLRELCWTIELQGSDEKEYYHRLGHGKPLGLGSVKICIDLRKERVIKSDREEYKLVSAEIPKMEWKNSQNADRLLMISDYRAVQSVEIRYPYVEVGQKANVLETIATKEAEGFELADNVLANHQWFSTNNDRARGHIPEKLPSIDDIYEKNGNYAFRAISISKFDIKENGYTRDFKSKTQSANKQRYPQQNAQQTHPRNRVKSAVEVTITGVAKSGSIFFIDNGQEGTVNARKLGGNSFRCGDVAKVIFDHEVVFEDGKKTRFYVLA